MQEQSMQAKLHGIINDFAQRGMKEADKSSLKFLWEKIDSL
jgi:hypothetical protein